MIVALSVARHDFSAGSVFLGEGRPEVKRWLGDLHDYKLIELFRSFKIIIIA